MSVMREKEQTGRIITAEREKDHAQEARFKGLLQQEKSLYFMGFLALCLCIQQNMIRIQNKIEGYWVLATEG